MGVMTNLTTNSLMKCTEYFMNICQAISIYVIFVLGIQALQATGPFTEVHHDLGVFMLLLGSIDLFMSLVRAIVMINEWCEQDRRPEYVSV